MMQVFEAIRNRRSVRAYQSEPVNPELVQTVLEAASQAPSAGNLQAYRVYVVRTESLKRDLATAALEQEFLANAPVALVFCAVAARSAKYGRRGAELYCVQDATIAAAYAQLAATGLGLATCWVGAFDEAALVRLLNLPGGQRPVAILPLGWPAEQPSPPSRRPLDELVKNLD